jgi:hypothetical protein
LLSQADGKELIVRCRAQGFEWQDDHRGTMLLRIDRRRLGAFVQALVP